MSQQDITEICRLDLFSAESQLVEKYPEATVQRVIRLRDMYAWSIANPDAKDRQFVEEHIYRYNLSRVRAYADLSVIKGLLPMLASASRDFHRWRFNEMILETYQMAKKRKDTKTMEKAAASYAKYNRVDLEDEQTVPFDLLIPQPFTATSDPTVLGIKPIPNIQDKIAAMLDKYRKETIDIEDIEFEEVDLEESELFPDPKLDSDDETYSTSNVSN